MPWKRHVRLVVFIAVLACIILFILKQSSESQYKGVPLSTWLNAYDPRFFGVQSKDETDEAVRHIGTNAIPTLLEMLRYRDSTTTVSVKKWVTSHDGPWLDYAEIKNSKAAVAFEALGPTAKQAVPELIEIYKSDISRESRCATVFALGCIGPDAQAAIPQLLEAATNTDSGLRCCAVRSLGQIHSRPDATVPILIMAAQDPDRRVHYEATNALAAFGIANAQSK